MGHKEPAVRLFSYGTLQLPQVQLATYGRLLESEPDILVGYRLEPLPISDAHVVRLSGKAVHMIARRSDDPRDEIKGVTLVVSESELVASDAYEADVYTRVLETLASGRDAYVYVGPPLADS